MMVEVERAEDMATPDEVLNRRHASYMYIFNHYSIPCLLPCITVGHFAVVLMPVVIATGFGIQEVVLCELVLAWPLVVYANVNHITQTLHKHIAIADGRRSLLLTVRVALSY